MYSTAVYQRAYAHAWGSNPPKDGNYFDKLKEVQGIFQRPTTGRNTRFGRRVEKPGDDRAAGPSGQHECTKHDRQHTNK